MKSICVMGAGYNIAHDEWCDAGFRMRLLGPCQGEPKTAPVAT